MQDNDCSENLFTNLKFKHKPENRTKVIKAMLQSFSEDHYQTYRNRLTNNQMPTDTEAWSYAPNVSLK